MHQSNGPLPVGKTACTPHQFDSIRTHSCIVIFHMHVENQVGTVLQQQKQQSCERPSDTFLALSAIRRWCDEKEKSQLIQTRRPRFFFVISVGIQVTLRVKNRVAADRGWGDLLPWEPSRQKPTYQKRKFPRRGWAWPFNPKSFKNKTLKPRLRCRRSSRSY